MLTSKTNRSPRPLANGSFRFAGRTFTHPHLVALGAVLVLVAYDQFTDADIDVVDDNGTVLVSLPNRPATVRP